ncbi:aldo/keto reductase [Saccharothrix coeruleofusca]|uniref:Oxidoreductase n=1 Tax=Saccharothrix coeruleofusca TaxID=33919 RepID=A0A918AS38_9PSEU|nr:aldo/keto reductase [Saccharothrix coeruleofusca]MBP2335768.1 aryl-alcohol dehydrogenase-like predicted oxidoreductase [Saccharothrix coeruleofusca]GGP75262.1 oxidoreductase [Saccharothrix coeruleofusca]
MELRTLAGAGGGLAVSALCLGTMHFGTKVDRRSAFAILDRFTEAGGTFIDTANTYAFWVAGGTGAESEELLGRWLASRRARDRVVLATKVGALPDPPGAAWPRHAEGLSHAVVRAGFAASARRLGTDHLDVYYAHIEDRRTPLEATAAAFGSLVTEGLVRVVGCSNHAAWRVAAAREIASAAGLPRFTCVQQRHTYLRPRPGAEFGVNPHISDELLDYAREEPDLAVLGYSVLLSGAYTRVDRPLPDQYDHADSTRRLAVLAEVADELGATRNQVVLAWLLRGDPPVLPVLGVSSVAQLDECLGALELELDDELVRRLDHAGQP